MPSVEDLEVYAESSTDIRFIPAIKTMNANEEGLYPAGCFWEFGLSTEESEKFTGDVFLPHDSMIKN